MSAPASVTPLPARNVDHLKQRLVEEWRHFMTSSTEQCNSGMFTYVLVYVKMAAIFSKN